MTDQEARKLILEKEIEILTAQEAQATAVTAVKALQDDLAALRAKLLMIQKQTLLAKLEE